MKILYELLPGCLLLQPNVFEDSRGSFVKTYHEGLNSSLGANLDIREEFYSTSRKDVIRGMHFQNPPHAHVKMVFCLQGAVRDVLLDLRKGKHYGKVAYAEITDENHNIIFIPKGVAHGFVALTDNALMLYKTNTVHDPAADNGIRWNSFEFNWGVEQPIISDRDKKHIELENFLSPF
jgi:dTDP-4-dehydrorhamnose 3,5-epimerase/CDP-3, 6-dideoxy-D-glycero-D-glycero-4-hexulose-5-epimerase